jgi:TPR repeat protein
VNYVEAARYFKLSADQGLAVGQLNYGICLHDGIDVSENCVEAARYFKL